MSFEKDVKDLNTKIKTCTNRYNILGGNQKLKELNYELNCINESKEQKDNLLYRTVQYTRKQIKDKTNNPRGRYNPKKDRVLQQLIHDAERNAKKEQDAAEQDELVRQVESELEQREKEQYDVGGRKHKKTKKRKSQKHKKTKKRKSQKHKKTKKSRKN